MPALRLWFKAWSHLRMSTPPLGLPFDLEPSESVLWTGSPDPAAVLDAASALARKRAAIAVGVALAFTLFATREAGGDWRPMAALAVLAAALAVFLGLRPLLLAARARRTLYAVTSHRIVVREDGRRPRIRMFRSEHLVPLHVRQGEDGHGDVLFAVDGHDVGCPSCGCGAGLCPTPSGEIVRATEIRDRRIEAPVGFHAISDPDTVAAIISERFGVPRANAFG